MHMGRTDTHGQAGEEVWVFDIERRRRVARLRLPAPADGIHVTQEREPRLVLSDEDNRLHLYDGLRLNLQRTIDQPGTTTSPAMQALATHD
jgi:methylamine dehydrogenase heavy chain